jgi:uncharacterized membrane protein YadS
VRLATIKTQTDADGTAEKASGKKGWRGFASLDSRTVFLLGLLIAGSGIVSPPVALVGGIAFGFAVAHPWRGESAKLAKLLLQASVVCLGFGMNLAQVVHAGKSGFVYTAIGITFAMVLGILLGKVLSVSGKASYLITVGTAICGGSAIASVAPITGASEEEISVSMGTVFLLNSVALLLFPFVGHVLKLDQNQFGLWAALAIHDTSSVVGAAAAYGAQALQIGTTGKSKVKMPWFILMFCAAAALSTYVPRFHDGFAALSHLGKLGLTATLFLIGTGLSQETLKRVGARPLVQGVVLWIVVGSASLAAIYFRVISI